MAIKHWLHNKTLENSKNDCIQTVFQNGVLTLWDINFRNSNTHELTVKMACDRIYRCIVKNTSSYETTFDRNVFLCYAH